MPVTSMLLTARATLASALLTQGAASPVDPIQAAREVFAGSDFWWKRLQTGKVPETPWLQSILNAIIKAIGNLLDVLFRFIAKLLIRIYASLGGESSGGTWFVWILAGALVLLAVWKLAPTLLAWFQRTKVAVPLNVEAETLPESSELRIQAEEALRAGRYDEAVRLALLALISMLEAKGLLRYDTTRTNREYRTELRARPELADRFGRLARIHETIWYGRMPASREQAEESIRLFHSTIDSEALSPG